MRLKWKLVLVRFEIVLILIQDRCTVCAERTINMEIILDTPDETPRLLGNLVLVHLEMVLVAVQDRSIVCTKRTIAS
jgi:hypothetical protein